MRMVIAGFFFFFLVLVFIFQFPFVNVREKRSDAHAGRAGVRDDRQQVARSESLRHTLAECVASGASVARVNLVQHISSVHDLVTCTNQQELVEPTTRHHGEVLFLQHLHGSRVCGEVSRVGLEGDTVGILKVAFDDTVHALRSTIGEEDAHSVHTVGILQHFHEEAPRRDRVTLAIGGAVPLAVERNDTATRSVALSLGVVARLAIEAVAARFTVRQDAASDHLQIVLRLELRHDLECRQNGVVERSTVERQVIHLVVQGGVVVARIVHLQQSLIISRELQQPRSDGAILALAHAARKEVQQTETRTDAHAVGVLLQAGIHFLLNLAAPPITLLACCGDGHGAESIHIERNVQRLAELRHVQQLLHRIVQRTVHAAAPVEVEHNAVILASSDFAVGQEDIVNQLVRVNATHVDSTRTRFASTTSDISIHLHFKATHHREDRRTILTGELGQSRFGRLATTMLKCVCTLAGTNACEVLLESSDVSGDVLERIHDLVEVLIGDIAVADRHGVVVAHLAKRLLHRILRGLLTEIRLAAAVLAAVVARLGTLLLIILIARLTATRLTLLVTLLIGLTLTVAILIAVLAVAFARLRLTLIVPLLILILLLLLRKSIERLRRFDHLIEGVSSSNLIHNCLLGSVERNGHMTVQTRLEVQVHTVGQIQPGDILTLDLKEILAHHPLVTASE